MKAPKRTGPGARAVKVLVLSNIYPPDFIGGYELACSQAVDGLLGRGHDVRVLTSVPRRPTDGDGFVDPLHVVRRFALADEWSAGAMGEVAVHHLITHSASRFVSSHNVHVLLNQLDEFAPDVVYLHSLIGVGGLGLVACLTRLGVPWVWQLGDCLPKRLCSSRQGPVIAELAAEFSRQVSGHYILVSRRVLTEIEGAGITLNGRLSLLPNWTHGERPAPRVRVYDGVGLRILSVGQVNRDKGVDVLIEAAGLLRAGGFHDFRIDVFGRSTDPGLDDLARGLGLGEHLVFRGARSHEEVARLYAEYDLLAFPTLAREPFGLVALEAAARGCVPLVSRDCGVAEWLVHGVHCLKADRSPRGFADAILGVAEGRTPLGPIARRASALATTDFHLDAVIPAVERILARAADEGSGRPPHYDRAGEAYRLAMLAERLSEGLIQERAIACA